MKNECDLVKDLLFNYNDGILSAESKELVEKHLKNCENCRKLLEEIKQDSKDQKPIKEIDSFKSVKKKLNKKNAIIIIGIIFLVFIIIFNVFVFHHYNEVASKMEIYLQLNVSDEEIEKIKNKIIEISDNLELEYISKEKALERMRNKFGDKSYLFDNYEQNNPFPASIEIKTNTKIELIVSAIQDMPGIERIITHEKINPYKLFFYDVFANKN